MPFLIKNLFVFRIQEITTLVQEQLGFDNEEKRWKIAYPRLSSDDGGDETDYDHCYSYSFYLLG